MDDAGDDATVVFRAADVFAPPPLRDPVLAGTYFGRAAAIIADRLARLIAGTEAAPLTAWFGAAQARAFARDPEACRRALDRDIAAIDELIAAQLDAILHGQKLRRLEGRWRGLAWLVGGIEPGTRVRVKILDIAWTEICRDLERAAEFDQSQMFRKIYEEEFGSPGGEPYGLLVIDHEVRHRPTAAQPTDDIAAIAAFSAVAAAAFSPTVLAAHPALLQADEFRDLATAGDLGTPFRGPEYTRWNALSGREDMRFMAVTLPRVLARAPWADDPARADGFRYAEYAPDADARVWMNAGFAFAACVARAFATHAWPADVRGSDTDRLGGGLVDDLATEGFSTDPPQVWPRPPLDIVLTDRQERALADAGLMPLGLLPYGTQAVFGVVRSLQAPATYIGPTADAANANARLSAQLNSILCVSRFAHYLKVLGRELVGSFRTADEIENELQRWVTGYVNASVDGGSETRARYPLVDARVSVRELPGRPGVFGATMHLQPHFQLDDVAATFRLVTEISQPGSRRAA
jgi:type VI secretion system protein ImpD/type VI secretion system protein ImpC